MFLLCFAMFCYVLLCFAMFCYVFLCFTMFSYVLLCFALFTVIPAEEGNFFVGGQCQGHYGLLR